jgi:hypothetical protein
VSKSVSVQALAPISNMQGLQSLTLGEQACPDFDDLLPVLPPGLTPLHLGEAVITPEPTALQSFSRLGNLQELVLTDVWLDPQVCHGTLHTHSLVLLSILVVLMLVWGRGKLPRETLAIVLTLSHVLLKCINLTVFCKLTVPADPLKCDDAAAASCGAGHPFCHSRQQ